MVLSICFDKSPSYIELVQWINFILKLLLSVSTEEFNRRLYKLYHSHEEGSTIQQQSSKVERRHVTKISIKRQHINNDVVVTSSTSLASSSVNHNKEDETAVMVKSSSSTDDTVLVQKQPHEKQRRLDFDDKFDEEIRYEQKLAKTKKKICKQYQFAREAKEKRQICVILDLHDLPPLPSDSTILSGKNKRKRSHGGMNILPATRNNNRLLRV